MVTRILLEWLPAGSSAFSQHRRSKARGYRAADRRRPRDGRFDLLRIRNGRGARKERCRGARSSVSHLIYRPSLSEMLVATFVGRNIEVAAFLANPVADQILGALKLLRPCIAGYGPRALPYHVELTIGLDLPDEDGLRNVVVRQHLRVATGEIWNLEFQAVRRSLYPDLSTSPSQLPSPTC